MCRHSISVPTMSHKHTQEFSISSSRASTLSLSLSLSMCGRCMWGHHGRVVDMSEKGREELMRVSAWEGFHYFSGFQCTDAGVIVEYFDTSDDHVLNFHLWLLVTSS